MPALTNLRHELFCQGVAARKTYVKAFVDAGYASGKNNSQMANQLKRRPEIKARIEELSVKPIMWAQAEAVYNQQVAMEETRLALIMAMELENPAAAIQAIALRAKLSGLLVDKKEVRTGTLDDKSDDELDRIIRNAAAEAKISIGIAGTSEETQH